MELSTIDCINYLIEGAGYVEVVLMVWITKAEEGRVMSPDALNHRIIVINLLHHVRGDITHRVRHHGFTLG